MALEDNIKNGNIEDSTYKKPFLFIPQLIAEALNNAPEKTLVLSDIYKAINAKYPYYKLETHGWQNSIRHNLSANKNFIKGEKSADFEKHGCYWKLLEDHSIPTPKVVKVLPKDKICSHCSKGFTSHDELKYHISKLHSFVQVGKLQKSEDSHEALVDQSILENTMEGNPWLVENVQAFSFLNCPECTFKVKEENLFQDHAEKNHSLSSVLFGTNLKTECVYIKTEPNEDITEDQKRVKSEPNEKSIEPHMVKTELNEDITEHQIIDYLDNVVDIKEPSEDISEHNIIKSEPIDPLDSLIENGETLEKTIYPDFSNKPIKLTYPHFDKNTSISTTEKLKRTIRTVGTSIAVEIPSKKVKGDSNLNSADGMKASTSQPNILKRSIDTSITIEIPSKMKKGFYRVSPSVDVQGNQSAHTSDQTNVQQTMEKDNSNSEAQTSDQTNVQETIVEDNSNSESGKNSGLDKPNISYAKLIFEALDNAPEQTLVVSDIYKAISAKHPFYLLENQGWQNSIRINLTLNKNFIKGERFGYWKLSKDVSKSLLETKQEDFDFSKNPRNNRTGEKKCEFCKEVFETRLCLIQHIQESHAVESETNNREKRYTCNICNVFKAYYMSVIRKHKKGCENLMNGLNVNMQDNGQFKCPHCPYVHEKNYQIKRHIKDMHQDISTDYQDTNAKKENRFLVTNESGVKVYSCSKCKMKFSCFNAQHIEKCWNNVSN